MPRLRREGGGRIPRVGAVREAAVPQVRRPARPRRPPGADPPDARRQAGAVRGGQPPAGREQAGVALSGCSHNITERPPALWSEQCTPSGEFAREPAVTRRRRPRVVGASGAERRTERPRCASDTLPGLADVRRGGESRGAPNQLPRPVAEPDTGRQTLPTPQGVGTPSPSSVWQIRE